MQELLGAFGSREALGALPPTCWLAAPLRFAEAAHHGSMAQQLAQLPHKEKAAGAGGQQADRHAAGVGRSPERVSASQSRSSPHFPKRGRRSAKREDGVAPSVAGG